MHILLLFISFLATGELCVGIDSNPHSEGLGSTLLSFYQDLHSHPELSFQEKETSKKFALELNKAGFEVRVDFGGYGVVGLLKNGKGPTLLLRTDLDALPVKEETNLAYASLQKQRLPDGRETPVMHACGHDIHISNMVGVARVMSNTRNDWKGTLLIIGQPAEEKGGGAKAMLEAGLYKKFPKPDFALALHVDPTLPSGKIALKKGYLMANVDTVDITLYGRGGHGALPHTTIDPIVMAATLVLELQTLISREKAPTEPGVITVGSIHGGSKHNIIPDKVQLQLTVRSLSKETRETLLEGISRKAKAVAVGMKAPEPNIHTSEEPVPALYNDDLLVERLHPILSNKLGSENVLQAELAMVGEDFSRYSEGKVPSMLFLLGSISEKRLKDYKKNSHIPSLHSGSYYPDPEATLNTGIKAMSIAATTLLQSNKN